MQIEDHLKNDRCFPNILFVDDEDNILKAITRSLKKHPFNVFVAQKRLMLIAT